MGQFDALTTSSRQQERSARTPRIFLGLGSNLGSRLAYISEALKRFEDGGIIISECSSLYETQPVEVANQPDFINLNCEIKTDLDADELLETCLAVERKMGRIRAEPKGPRIIDIDILFYGERIFHSDRLSIPHPAIAYRRFVLVPMVEIAPAFQDPVSGQTMRGLLERCPDRSTVRLVGPCRDISWG